MALLIARRSHRRHSNPQACCRLIPGATHTPGTDPAPCFQTAYRRKPTPVSDIRGCSCRVRVLLAAMVSTAHATQDANAIPSNTFSQTLARTGAHGLFSHNAPRTNHITLLRQKKAHMHNGLHSGKEWETLVQPPATTPGQSSCTPCSPNHGHHEQPPHTRTIRLLPLTVT